MSSSSRIRRAAESFERDPERVLHDLSEGWITAERARYVYGVATTGDAVADTLAVDGPATQALRATMRAAISGGASMADDLTQTIKRPGEATQDWSAGAAYVDGAVMPLRDAKIPITDWGYRRSDVTYSDVTYDVVSVYFGAFFRLDDHLRRFRASLE